MNELAKIIAPGEEVLWEGKPSMWPFLWTGAILSAVVGIGLLLFLVPFIVVGVMTATTPETGYFAIGWNVFLIPFVAIALWSLFGVPIYKILAYKKMHYAITNKRVIVQSGVIGRDFTYIDFDKVQSATVNVGFWDGIFGETGSIIVTAAGSPAMQTNAYSVQNTSVVNTATVLSNIEKPYEVFKFFQKTSFDVKTDIEYPNAKRPSTNPGYETKLEK